MVDKEKITLDDIKSEGISIEDYIESNKDYKSSRDNYSPDEEIIKDIVAILDNKNEKLKIRAFGAKWCGDCKIQLPNLAKIVQILGDKADAEVFSNIMTKSPWLRKKGDFIWKSPPSPPESVDERFNMHHIPAIFIFTKNGKSIGKIDERPEKTKTLEGDILHYLKK